MDSNNLSLRDFNLISKYFSFLERYGFKYAPPNKFEGVNIRILIEFDKLTSIAPTIMLWVKTEPKFTCINLSWLFEEFIDYEKLGKSTSFEANIEYYAAILHEHIDQILNKKDMEKLLLKGLKRLYMNMVKFDKLTKHNYLNNMSRNARKHYQYIKNKDRRWDPSKELPN